MNWGRSCDIISPYGYYTRRFPPVFILLQMEKEDVPICKDRYGERRL